MNTITAKELRDNLGEITRRVRGGEHLQVTYRNQPSFKLEPITPTSKQLDPLEVLNQFLEKVQTVNTPERYRTGDLKQLYGEDMAKKYGIKE